MRIIVRLNSGLSHVGEYEPQSTLLELNEVESICIAMEPNKHFKVIIPVEEIKDIFAEGERYSKDNLEQFLIGKQ